MRVDVWSDIVCPWCYIGKRRFERAIALLDGPPAVEVVHRAFQLNPGAPKDGASSRRAHLMSKYGWSAPQADAMDARMQQVAAAEGLDYHLAGTSTGNTFDAHRVIHLARGKGLEDAALERLYRAYFTEQRSIFDHESLTALAVDAGLDREETARMLAGDGFADAVRVDRQDAAALQVSGVPFFVIDNRFAISGAQSADIFAEALRRAR
ncbi:MAG: DsbA family oxidoreductase [Acidimicrobiia bacterium]|nr:DsbA family oxidoreductase [Acidimicrobiia bacterium]